MKVPYLRCAKVVRNNNTEDKENDIIYEIDDSERSGTKFGCM